MVPICLSRPTCVVLLLSSISLLLLGCGDGRPERVPVSGQVLIDGQPLTHGFVQVAPAGARPATGPIGPDGRFVLTTFEPGDGCVPGQHPVAVIGVETLGPTSQRWLAPKQYASLNTSGLQVNIEGATDKLEINLTWKGAKPFEERFDAEGN